VSIVTFDEGTICPILIFLPNPSKGGAFCCDIFIFILFKVLDNIFTTLRSVKTLELTYCLLKTIFLLRYWSKFQFLQHNIPRHLRLSSIPADFSLPRLLQEFP